jgi:hypothetical protein
MANAYCISCRKPVSATPVGRNTSGYAIYDNGGPIDIAVSISGRLQYRCIECGNPVSTYSQDQHDDTESTICDVLFWFTGVPLFIVALSTLIKGEGGNSEFIMLGAIVVFSIYGAALFYGNTQLWSTLLVFITGVILYFAYPLGEKAEARMKEAASAEQAQQRRKEYAEKFLAQKAEEEARHALLDQSPPPAGDDISANDQSEVNVSITATYDGMAYTAFTVEGSKAEAVAKYPDLARSGTAFNREFVRRYHQYQGDRATFFNDVNWPLRLADEVSKQLISQ